MFARRWLRIAGFVFVCILGVWPYSATASESGTWTTLISPSFRHGAAAIRDPIMNRMVLYGGSTPSDVWTLSLEPDGRWQQLDVPGTQPPPRSFHSAIYDPVRRRMIVFGGNSTVGFNDVWELSLDGIPAWRPVHTVGPAPRARWGHSAIYDPDGDRMIVFGGGAGPTGRVFMNDVWALSFSTSTWIELTPGGQLPTPRAYGAAIHDPVRKRMLLFGGENTAGSALSELHELNLIGEPMWSMISVPLAPSASAPITAYDSAADRMVVWGPETDAESILYSLDLDHLTWNGGPVPRVVLPARFQAGVFDPPGNRFVTFGGLDHGGTSVGSRPRDTTWEISLTTSSVRTLFPGPPNPSGGSSMVVDPIGSRVIYVAPNTVGPRVMETWQLGLETGSVWQKLPTVGSAPFRAGYAIGFDSTRNRILMFGGNDTLQYRNDTWVLSLEGTPTWSELPVSDPLPPPMYSRGVIDPVGDRMIVLGTITEPLHDELWALSLDESAWLRLEPDGEMSCYAGPFLVYDSLRHRVLVPGTSVEQVNPPLCVYALELTPTLRWSEIPAIGAPRNMSRPITIFDSERDRLVVHGDTGEAADETWALAFSDPPVWTKLGTGPYHAMGAHDAHGDRIIAVAATHYAFQIPPATWQLQFGEEPTLEVGCPGTQPWSNPGTSLALEYSIVNPSKRPRLVDWTLASERDWPGFPIVGSVDVEGFETAVVPVEFVVPDSAAIGLNRLRFSGREAGEAEDAWFCEHLIGDLATPVLVSALAPEVLADAIVLRWLVADSDGGPLEVERRESAHAWEQVGLANPDGRDRVRYQDSEVDPGHTYTYRLEVPNPAGNTWAGLVEAKLPDIQLNVFVKRVDPVAGSVMLEAELPAPGEVRFEIFDTSGRRVASRSITGWTHGSHTAVLDLHDRSAGVFFVRLTHMGRSAIARFALIR